MNLINGILKSAQGGGLSGGIKGIVKAAQSGNVDNIVNASVGVLKQIAGAAGGAKG